MASGVGGTAPGSKRHSWPTAWKVGSKAPSVASAMTLLRCRTSKSSGLSGRIGPPAASLSCESSLLGRHSLMICSMRSISAKAASIAAPAFAAGAPSPTHTLIETRVPICSASA
jgi:hypothetical protein